MAEARYGLGVDYWDARHGEDISDHLAFDWLYEYSHLKHVLRAHVAPSASVLQLGCGNSRLALDWARDGHIGLFRNVDYSAVVVKQMQAEAPRVDGKLQFPNVSWEVADIRDLSQSAFASGSFDAVLDKGTFDCIACNVESYQADLEAMCLEAFRVLRPGGVLLSCRVGRRPRGYLGYTMSQDWIGL